MAQKTQSKASPRLTRPSRAKPSSGLRPMLMVKVPVSALRDFTLPPDAELAIVSSNPTTAKKIRRFGALRKVYTDADVSMLPRQTGVVNQDAFKPDARSQALLEGIRISEGDLRKAGGAYDLEQVRTLMRGVSRQAVEKRVQDGSLLAVPGPSNRRSYPTLQFNRDGTIVNGLKAVRTALSTSNPWTILNFLIHPDDRLRGRKPIDVLKKGDIALVIEAARRLGQQGA